MFGAHPSGAGSDKLMLKEEGLFELLATSHCWMGSINLIKVFIVLCTSSVLSIKLYAISYTRGRVKCSYV